MKGTGGRTFIFLFGSKYSTLVFTGLMLPVGLSCFPAVVRHLVVLSSLPACDLSVSDAD